MKVRELVQRLEADGWVAVRQGGTRHRIYRHPTKPGPLVVPIHDGKDLATGTLHGILKKAGLK